MNIVFILFTIVPFVAVFKIILHKVRDLDSYCNIILLNTHIKRLSYYFWYYIKKGLIFDNHLSKLRTYNYKRTVTLSDLLETIMKMIYSSIKCTASNVSCLDLNMHDYINVNL